MLDLNKPVQTRDGRKATILATNVLAHIEGTDARMEGQTVLALVDGEAKADYFYPNGSYVEGRSSDWDLITAPASPLVTERFLNVYDCGDSWTVYHRSHRAALAARQAGSRLLGATIKITYEDGKPVAAALV